MRVKICGITSPGDALLAAELGADAIGLNFYPPSPRFVDAATARRILEVLPPAVRPVAVLVRPSVEQMVRLHADLDICLFQCHAVAWAEWSAPPLSKGGLGGVAWRLLLAQGVSEEEDLEAARQQIAAAGQLGFDVAGLLVDARVTGQHGGTGRTAPWSLLAGFNPGVPLILAGGLTPNNVAEAVHIVRPDAVDVASGVESGPGVKDREKLQAFIVNARSALPPTP
jgi:phosphoribosylanthranilate isomerase